MTTDSPQTKAGKRLLSDLTLDYIVTPGDMVMPAVAGGLAVDILAIEREARAAFAARIDRTTLAETICSSLDAHGDSYGLAKHPSDLAHHVADAVIAAIEEASK